MTDELKRCPCCAGQEWKMRTRGYVYDEWQSEWRDVPEERED